MVGSYNDSRSNSPGQCQLISCINDFFYHPVSRVFYYQVKGASKRGHFHSLLEKADKRMLVGKKEERQELNVAEFLNLKRYASKSFSKYLLAAGVV